MIERISDGRTDLVFEYVSAGGDARSADKDGVSLIQWCSYYGDVSAIRFLLGRGEALASLGENLGLDGAAFHGHWQLCQFLLESGADVNHAQAETGETALHSALCRIDAPGQAHVVRVLLAHGADPHRVTRAGAETGGFMRDCRTRGETPLHRAAAFASLESIQLLLAAGARLDARDVNGDSPLSWASWHLRPVDVLRALCFGAFRIHPQHAGMARNLLGEPGS
jgi:ankyrin repeat protein